MSADRTVVVLPGRTFGPSLPQLFLPMTAAVRRGAEAVRLEWDAEVVARLPPAGWPEMVVERVRPLLEPLDPTRSLVLAKSLGTLAAGLAGDFDLPAVHVTPLLRTEVVVEGLRRATAPRLLVGGTADEHWDGVTARALSDHVLELPGADHGLFVPGRLHASAANLGLLADATERFLDEIVWL